MFTEFIKIKVKNGKVLVVGTAHGEETTEWCSLEEIRKAIEAAEQSVHPTLLTEPVNYCNPVNGVHAPFCTGHKSQSG